MTTDNSTIRFSVSARRFTYGDRRKFWQYRPLNGMARSANEKGQP